MDDTTQVSALGSEAAEQPTAKALLAVTARPLRIETGFDGVPASETRTLVTVIGLVAMGATGVLGSGVIMIEAPARHLVPYLAAALAQLIFTVAVATLIFRWTRPPRAVATPVLLTPPLAAAEPGETGQDRAEDLPAEGSPAEGMTG
jgi:hypothetical protein